MERKKTKAHYASDFKRQDDFDLRLRAAIERIRERHPDDWETVLLYLRTKAVAVRIDPEHEELVKAEYHRKAQVVDIVRKFQGFEGE